MNDQLLRAHMFTYYGFRSATVGPRNADFRGIYDVPAAVLAERMREHGFDTLSESNGGMMRTFSNEKTGESVLVEMYRA